LYGIGVGPGAPDLMTLRAASLLREIPVIFVPHGDAVDESRVLGIIRPLLTDGQEVRQFIAPMTRDRQARDRAWEEAAGRVLAVLDSGRDAAFLTLGDSTLYSTYFYLLEVLRRRQPDLPVETVPGVTSFSAAASLLNRALAMGQEGLAVVPATRGGDYLRQVLSTFENVVLLKAGTVLREVQDLLAELGRLEDASYVCRCGMPGEFVKGALAPGDNLPGDYFSLILVLKGKGSEMGRNRNGAAGRGRG
jgi:precorrin-2/cobalt-factor-2 C20-methyltransferase